MFGSFFKWLLEHIEVYFAVVVHICIHSDVVLEDINSKFSVNLPGSSNLADTYQTVQLVKSF